VAASLLDLVWPEVYFAGYSICFLSTRIATASPKVQENARSLKDGLN
jgi:hypothetical protein